MSEQVKIYVWFDDKGNAEVEVVGMTGPSCKTLTADLEKVLFGDNSTGQTCKLKETYHQYDTNRTATKLS